MAARGPTSFEARRKRPRRVREFTVRARILSSPFFAGHNAARARRNVYDLTQWSKWRLWASTLCDIYRIVASFSCVRCVSPLFARFLLLLTYTYARRAAPISLISAQCV